MKNAITEIGNHDLYIAVKSLYCAADVLRNIPRLQIDFETQVNLITAVKLAIQSSRIVLGDIANRLTLLEQDSSDD